MASPIKCRNALSACCCCCRWASASICAGSGVTCWMCSGRPQLRLCGARRSSSTTSNTSLSWTPPASGPAWCSHHATLICVRLQLAGSCQKGKFIWTVVEGAGCTSASCAFCVGVQNHLTALLSNTHLPASTAQRMAPHSHAASLTCVAGTCFGSGSSMAQRSSSGGSTRLPAPASRMQGCRCAPLLSCPEPASQGLPDGQQAADASTFDWRASNQPGWTFSCVLLPAARSACLGGPPGADRPAGMP